MFRFVRFKISSKQNIQNFAEITKIKTKTNPHQSGNSVLAWRLQNSCLEGPEKIRTLTCERSEFGIKDALKMQA